MLIKRLITASILIPLVIIGLFLLPFIAFVGLMVVICGMAAWEWSQFLKYDALKSRIIFTLLFVILSIAVYYIPTALDMQLMIFESILVLSVAWWLVALVLVISYPISTHFWRKSRVIRWLFAFFTLIPFFVGMVELRQLEYHVDPYYGAYLLLYVLVLVWATDSGAYFAGKSFGKNKLAPRVSPGKTIEGLLGGLATSLIVALFVYLLRIFDISFYDLMITSVLAILASVLGDLTESMFKREANLKDSGNLIPGHGGILDRIDSLTAAIPVFTAILLYLT